MNYETGEFVVIDILRLKKLANVRDPNTEKNFLNYIFKEGNPTPLITRSRGAKFEQNV